RGRRAFGHAPRCLAGQRGPRTDRRHRRPGRGAHQGKHRRRRPRCHRPRAAAGRAPALGFRALHHHPAHRGHHGDDHAPARPPYSGQRGPICRRRAPDRPSRPGPRLLEADPALGYKRSLLGLVIQVGPWRVRFHRLDPLERRLPALIGLAGGDHLTVPSHQVEVKFSRCALLQHELARHLLLLCSTLVGLLPLTVLTLALLAPTGTVIAVLATKFLLRELFALLLRGLLTLPDLLRVLLRFFLGLVLQLVEVARHRPSIPTAGPAAPVKPWRLPRADRTTHRRPVPSAPPGFATGSAPGRWALSKHVLDKLSHRAPVFQACPWNLISGRSRAGRSRAGS